MGLDENFNTAVEDVRNLDQTPKDDDLLELYALYKQATVGDVNIPKPGLFDFKGKAKWEAWNGKKGMPQEEAKESYVAKAKAMVEQCGLKK